MMIKKIIILLIFVIILFPNNVCADYNENISYDVEKMIIGKNSIEFKGWAIIDRANNYGGKSLNISIIAVSSSGKEFEVKNINYGGRNLYLSKCLNVGHKCIIEALSTCRPNVSNNQNDQSCIYRSIDFDIKFSIEDLKKKFGNENIEFKLNLGIDKSCKVVQNKIGSIWGIWDQSRMIAAPNNRYDLICSGGEEKYTVGLGVAHNRVFDANGNKVSIDTSGTASLGEYSFQVSGVSSTVYIPDSNDLIQKASGNKYGSGIYFRSGSNSLSNLYYPIYNNRYQVFMYAIDGYSYKPAYAISSWLAVNGSVKLNISNIPIPEEKTVSTCNGSSKNKNNKVLDCSVNSKEQRYDSTVCRTYESVVYYFSDCASCSCDEYDRCDCKAGNIKSKISANVNYTQSGKLTITMMPQSLKTYSGGKTHFNVIYDNTISWNYLNDISYYGYSEYEIVSSMNSGSSCSRVSISSDDIEERIYEDRDSSYIKDSRKNYVNDGEKIIEKLTANDYDKNFLSTLNSINTNISVPNNDLYGVWSGNNASVGVSWGPGNAKHAIYTFNIYDAYLNRITADVIYKNDGSEAANDEFKREKTYFIPLDYSDGNYNFKFNVSDLSVMKNGVDLFNWSVNYNCGVECTQKFFNLLNKGYYFQYRQVDLNNVFPNDYIGLNWKNYLDLNQQYKSNNIVSLPDEVDKEDSINLNSQNMTDIRKYNELKDTNGGDGYLDLSINNNGDSNFLKEKFSSNDYDSFELGCGFYNQGVGGCP